ncbi:hypothetical protein K5V07_10095 [Flavobacterium sp. CHNK8]|uniref:hypothetical protein n=1 Tax=Flavobacterium sp. CHNK8 TaxID=2871165 RepID=UPI001C8DC4D6|nr:hypothetical protein [Flavobacterium sp. CHNK8]QZK90820.1 hypothetical protein K5V07_10095 [Flavobacterium sp. CHNK8]
MKTYTLPTKKPILLYLFGFISILFSSCGTYQNSSYYDSDGIYGGTTSRTPRYSQPNETSTSPYASYFNSLQNNNEPVEILTDIDNYNVDNDSIQNYTDYAGWGSNPQSVSINIYDNSWGRNNWGWNTGYGWGGYPGWGWNNMGWNTGFGWGGYPGWGWNTGIGWGGYPGWGWNTGFGWGGNIGYGWNNWYGNNWGYVQHYNPRNYSYNSSRRGSSYANTSNSNRGTSSYTRSGTNVSSRRTDSNYSNSNGTYYGRGSASRMSRTSPVFSRNQTQESATYNSNRRGSGSTRTESSTPSRTYTPSRGESNSRSYTPSSSSSSSSSRSGGSYGGGGGGRSSGGGGRGGRG